MLLFYFFLVVTIVLTACIDALYFENDHWKIEIGVMIPLVFITLCACGSKESQIMFQSKEDDTDMMFGAFEETFMTY